MKSPGQEKLWTAHLRELLGHLISWIKLPLSILGCGTTWLVKCLLYNCPKTQSISVQIKIHAYMHPSSLIRNAVSMEDIALVWTWISLHGSHSCLYTPKYTYIRFIHIQHITGINQHWLQIKAGSRHWAAKVLHCNCSSCFPEDLVPLHLLYIYGSSGKHT